MWNALTSSSNFVLESLETFAESTGVSGLIANMGWGSLIMICVAFFLLYLAIKHKFEPLLLLTIAFGMLLTNLPGANLYHTELFAGGHVHWDIFVAQAGLLDYLYLGVKLGIYPCLIFVGVGAMTDFGPLIANPKSFLLGAAAQLGIFLTFIGAYALGFSPAEAGSIGIIGGADGPTSIYLTAILAPELLGPIAVAAYSYMALVPVIQPPIMRMLTTEKERKIKMRQLRPVSKTEKILFPIIRYLFRTAKPKAVPQIPPTMCIKLATLSCIKRILYTCWLKYSTPTKIKVIGIPPFLLPAKLESMMSMNTIPDAPSNAEVGNSTHCNMPDTSAVIRIPLRSVRLPYRSSKGGAITRKRSILFIK